MGEPWSPPLHLTDVDGGCRLTLAGCAHGHGRTLQEASDDLLRSLLRLAATVRAAAAVGGSTDLPPPDDRVVRFLHDIGRIAETGGDVRGRVFDPGSARPRR